MSHIMHATRSPSTKSGCFLSIAVPVIVIVFSAAAAPAQDASPSPTPTQAVSAEVTPGPSPSPSPSLLLPFIKDLQGVAVGMPRKEVEHKLGSAKVSDQTGAYYEFSKNRSAQIGFDADSSVLTVALIFTGGDKSAPTFADVFGPDVHSDAKADGDIYKLVRYPDAGIWISYSLTNAGKQATTVVTMHAISK